MEQKSDVATGKRFKCTVCWGFINDISKYEGIEYKDKEKTKPFCPDCGTPMVKMCENDKPCTCIIDVTPGITYCEKCGAMTCPCGSENVTVWSRVTGYLQSVESFNASKKQEVRDRHKWNLGDA